MCRVICLQVFFPLSRSDRFRLPRYVLHAGHLSLAPGGHRHGGREADGAAHAHPARLQHPDVGPVLLLLPSRDRVRATDRTPRPRRVVRHRAGDGQRVTQSEREERELTDQGAKKKRRASLLFFFCLTPEGMCVQAGCRVPARLFCPLARKR